MSMKALVHLDGRFFSDDYGGSVWGVCDVTYFKTPEGTIVRQSRYNKPVGPFGDLWRRLRGKKREDYIAMTDSQPLSDMDAVLRLAREADESTGKVSKWLQLEHDPTRPGVL